MARELALDIGDGSYRPSIVTHIPGISNVIADALSRRFQEGRSFILPIALEGVPEVHPPARSRGYYKSLSAPQAG